MGKDRGGSFSIVASGIVALACFTYVFTADRSESSSADTGVKRAKFESTPSPPEPTTSPEPTPEPAPQVSVPAPAPEPPPVVAQPTDPIDPPTDHCDEVDCVLADYKPECCVRFRKDRGYLQITTRPEATVLVDGEATGLTT